MVYVEGFYIGSDVSVKEKDGVKKEQTVLMVADGMDAVRVYLKDKVDMSAYALGDPIKIAVRPYGKNGVGYYSGTIQE